MKKSTVSIAVAAAFAFYVNVSIADQVVSYGDNGQTVTAIADTKPDIAALEKKGAESAQKAADDRSAEMRVTHNINFMMEHSPQIVASKPNLAWDANHQLDVLPKTTSVETSDSVAVKTDAITLPQVKAPLIAQVEPVTDTLKVKVTQPFIGKIEDTKGKHSEVETIKGTPLTASTPRAKVETFTPSESVKAVAYSVNQNTAGIQANRSAIVGTAAGVQANRDDIDATNQAVSDHSAKLAAQEKHIESLEASTNANFGKLKSTVDDNRKRASAGIAGVAAMANIPQVIQGQTFAVGAGVGTADSENAVAVGFSARATESTVVKASVSTDSQHNFVAGAGVSYGW